MKIDSDPYSEYQLLQKIKELRNDYNALKWEIGRKNAEIIKLNEQHEKQVKALQKTIRYYDTAIKFTATYRRTIKRKTCRLLDRLNFDDAEIILPHIEFPHGYTLTPYREIFYMWLRGYTYQEIGIATQKSTERIRQILMKTGRLYNRQREGILKKLEVIRETSLITNDYRNNREEMINQIKGVYQ